MAAILITGANRGIGLALARAYAEGGDSVIATARDPGKAEALKQTGAEVHALEATEAASVAALAEALGDRPVDLLIHNAGVGHQQGFGALDYDEFARVLAVNTIAPMRVVEALAPNVAASEDKTIVVLSSQMGSIENTNADFGLIYRVSKAGVNMALRAAAPALAQKGITLLTLHPGWVKTDMGGQSAPVTPEDSAAGLKAAIAGAGPAKELRFLDWQGNTLPW